MSAPDGAGINAKAPLHGSMQCLAGWLLALAPSLLLLVLLQRPIQDVDIFWQLKLGELAIDRGSLITVEPFAAHHLGEPLAPLAWLAQVTLACVRHLGGWGGLQVFDALVWLSGFLAVSLACRKRGDATIGVLAAMLLTFAAALMGASIRPQTFALLCFGSLIALLMAGLRPVVTVALGSLLLVTWQNFHPSVAVAALYLGAGAGWGWLAWLKGPRAEAPWLKSALALIAVLATFATPLGFGILSISARNAAASVAMGVTEWHAIWDPLNAGLLPGLLPVPLIFVLMLAARRGAIQWDWLVPSLVLLAASCLAIRFVSFWAISAIPVIARLIAPVQGERASSKGRTLIALALLAATALTMFEFHKPRFAPNLPLPAIAALKASATKGTVYAEFPWGGPLIDAGYPAWKVAFDGRYYVYSDAEWDFARRVGRGGVPLEQLERSYHPAAFLLSPAASPALLARLRAERGEWHEVYADNTSVALVRVKAPAAAAQSAARLGSLPAGRASGP